MTNNENENAFRAGWIAALNAARGCLHPTNELNARLKIFELRPRDNESYKDAKERFDKTGEVPKLRM